MKVKLSYTVNITSQIVLTNHVSLLGHVWAYLMYDWGGGVLMRIKNSRKEG